MYLPFIGKDLPDSDVRQLYINKYKKKYYHD